MKIALEPFGENFWREAGDMLRDEWQGHGLGAWEVPLAVDREFYDAIADDIIYAAIREEGKLVGYFVAHLAVDIHSEARILRPNGLYIAPEARGGRSALRAVQMVLDEGTRRGAQWHVLTNTVGPVGETAAKLYRLLGFVPFETIWIKKANAACAPKEGTSP